MENATDYNADSSGQGDSGNSDTGSQDTGAQNTDPNDSQGQSGNQQGQQPGQGNAEVNKLRNEIRVLNKALVDAKRGNRQTPVQNQDGQQDDPYNTPQGQYGIALQLATGELRGKLEDVFSLYPELDPADVARIRKNPWAFASHDSYINGDYEAAKTEIEQNIYDQLEAAGKLNDGGQQGQQQNQQGQPAQVNSNPAQEPAAPAAPGSTEDQNPWTMPMDKLEQVANAEIAKRTKKS